MRLFTAVELPEEVRAAIAAAAEPVVGPLPGARTVTPANLHVTLRFLGETPEAKLAPLQQAIAAAVAEVPAGRARVAGFGAFPNAKQPRVVWAGIDDPAGTFAAAERAISEAIAPHGYPPEARPYTAHVTIARVDVRGIAWRRRGPFDNLTLPPASPVGPEFDVREVVLFRSELTPRGSIYRIVSRNPLAAST